MEKVEKLEKEIKELKFKITNLEERVLNTETFISFIKNNINSAPVKDSTNPFLGLKSNLTISEPLETLMNAIYSNTVPISQEHSSFQNISNMGLAENNINPEPVSPEEVPLESNDNNDNFPVLSPVLSTTNSTQSPNTNILPEVNDILEKNENNTEINDISDNENSTEANNIPENENNSEVNNVSDNENDDEINSIHDNENISEVNNISDNENNSEVNNIHDNENDIVANNISDNESNAEVNNISDNENNSEVNNIHDNENDTEVNNISDNVNNAEVNNISDNRNISEVNNIHDNENDTVANNIFDNENDDKINNISDNESNTINQYIVDKNILKATKNINTESWIGKILMGALASLLVFIALITFAKALLPYLTNTLKIALMFVSSIALTATGYVFNTKKPKNTFYKALLACGSACIYLSILMTRIYFKAVSSIGMYVLIALWAVLNIFFKKDKNNWLFFAIGNLGYLVSIIFSQGLKTNDESLIIPLLIYVVMISVIYQIMYWKNVYQRHIQNIINIISLLLLQYIITSKFNEITEVIIVGLATIAYIFIYFIKYTFIDLLSYKKEDVYIKIVSTSLYFLCIYMSIFVMGTYFKSISLIVTYVLITLWTILNIFFKKDKTDWFFFAVGNIGYLGSILSSAKLSINDKSFITPVFIYVVMISLIYQIMYWKNVYQRHIQNIINIIYVLLFQYIITSIFNEITEVIIVGLATITYIFIHFIKYAFIDLLSYKEENVYTKIIIKIVNTSLYLLGIYMSIFVMGTSFKTISLIVMYALTTLWTILNIFFKKDKDDWLFFAVGNIGYLGSILSSVDLSINDKSIIIPTLIYVIIISVVYQIMYWKNIYQRHIQNIINIISLLLFQYIITSIFNEITEVIIVGLVTITFIFIYFIKYAFIDLLSYKEEDDYIEIVIKTVIKIVSTSLYLLCIYKSIFIMGTYFKTTSLIVMYVLTTLWTLLNIFFKKDKDDWLFFAVGNIGYLGSILSSVDLSINDKSIIIPTLIYVIIISVVYQIMYWKNIYQRHIQNIINIISLLLFQHIIASIFNEIPEVIIVGLITIAFIFIYFIKHTFIDLLSYKNEDVNIKIVSTSLYLLCIYMSISVLGTYFKTVSLIVIYVLTTLWTILNIFFKKDKTDRLFFAVGNIGYLGSILSSVDLSINDKFIIIPTLIYALMISVVYQIMYWKNECQRHIQSIINVLSLLIFHFIITSIFRKTTEFTIVTITTIVFALIGSIQYTMFDFFIYKKEHFYIALLNISVYFLTYIRLNNILKLNLPAILTFIVIIIPTILLEIINMYWRSKNLADIDKNIVNDVLSSILFYEASFTMGARNHFLYSSGIILAVYSSIMIYGIIKKDSFFKNQAWILLSLCMYSEKKLFVSKVYEFDGNNLPFTVVAVILLLVFLIVEGFVLNDSETYKLISYFAVLSWIIRTGVYAYNYYTSSYFTGIIYYTQVKKPFVIDKEYIINITYGIIALLNMVLILTKFYKLKERKEINTLSDILNDEKKTCIRILLDIFNLTFMLFGVIMMYVSDSNIQLQIIYMVIVLLLAFINLPVKDAANRERYIYTAVKFSFLIYYSLWIFKIENYVTSISMIAFAVVCIAIGFWNRLIGKELRIYGLVMTIIFVIKLIIIDISYDSSVLKASSYLMSGGLCFGISAIYNYFEDNNNNNNNNNNNDNDKKNN